MTEQTRRIDDLGRVHIPKPIREDLGIEAGDELKIEITENGILLIAVKEVKP